MNLKARFTQLHEKLKLLPAIRAKAEETHTYLGDLLVEAGLAKRTRLQGSFARHTMRGPELHDIDKIVEISDSLRAVLLGPGGAAKAMKLMRDALAPHLPGATFEYKKHALAITLPGDGFNFDAVPAFIPEDGTGWILIADTEDDSWEASNTYLLIDTIAARNQACDGRFVHQVRMAKQAVHHAGLDEVVPGLHVETFAYHAISRALDHPTAVAAILATGARLLGEPYLDPTGHEYISDRLDPADIVKAKAGLQRLAELAAEAERCSAAGDETAAACIWADIFGPLFPRPRDEKTFLQGLHTGAGTEVARPPTPTTRAWRPV